MNVINTHSRPSTIIHLQRAEFQGVCRFHSPLGFFCSPTHAAPTAFFGGCAAPVAGFRGVWRTSSLASSPSARRLVALPSGPGHANGLFPRRH